MKKKVILFMAALAIMSFIVCGFNPVEYRSELVKVTRIDELQNDSRRIIFKDNNGINYLWQGNSMWDADLGDFYSIILKNGEIVSITYERPDLFIDGLQLLYLYESPNQGVYLFMDSDGNEYTSFIGCYRGHAEIELDRYYYCVVSGNDVLIFQDMLIKP